jgi:hypothetical protein
MALFTYPPLRIVLAGGAGEEGRLAQTRAHDEEALTNPYELARAHDLRSVVVRDAFRNNRRANRLGAR